MIRSVENLAFENRRIFLRVDFNVPLIGGRILETHRIDAALPTLRLLLPKAGRIILVSHLGRPGGKRELKYSLEPARAYLERTLARPVTLAPDCVGPEVERLLSNPRQTQVVLLENLRFHKEEEANDPKFSKDLASLGDIYVNDAFGAAHRAHASTAGMTKFFREKGVGLLFKKELDYLGGILSSREKPLVAIIGGAKVSDKIGVLKNLLPKVDSLLVGGGMAYTFLKARGRSVGKSLLLEADSTLAQELIEQAAGSKTRLLLPSDHVTALGTEDERGATVLEGDIPENRMGLDIGPKTIAEFSQEVNRARMVLWNGPMGLFEKDRYSRGTKAIAEALARCGAISIVAGGDTVAAVRQAGVGDNITHLSTGGGATLEFLEGRKLPGVQALEETP